MHHDLTPDIVEQLERQYEADLARTRAMYSPPWLCTRVEDFREFEAPPPSAARWTKAFWLMVATWLFGCTAVGPIVDAVGDVATKLPIAPVRSLFGVLK